MYPKELRGLLDHVYELYTKMYEETHKLRRENRGLIEELAKQRQPPMEQVEAPGPIKRLYKMGADWHIEGDRLFELSLMQKLRFYSPICNVKMSAGGQIAFTCNKRLFLLREGAFYVVEDGVRWCDPAQMRNDLVENYRCVFDFDGESLVMVYRNSLIKYTENCKEWSVPVGSVYGLVVWDGACYVGLRDNKVITFRDGECINIIDHKEPIRQLGVVDGVAVGCSEGKVGVIGRGTPMVVESSRVLALEAGRDRFFYGCDTGVVKICAIKQGVCDVVDTLILKKPVLAIKQMASFLIVACQDKSFSIWDLSLRRCMKVVCSDNVVDIAVNGDKICCVDNNGSLRIWQIIK